MMKKVLTGAIAALVAGALPLTAGPLTGRFHGGGTLSNWTPACINDGWVDTPERYEVRYHPRGVGSNRDRDSIAFYGGQTAMSFILNGGNFSNAWQPVTHAFLGSGITVADQNQPEAARIRILSMWPNNLDENTDQPVRIRGQIQHLALARWCRVDFDVIVQQR